MKSQFHSSVTLDGVRYIADRWKQKDGYLEALKQVESIEEGFGPIGIWSVKLENRAFSFRYPKKFDGIYRELKYVYMRFFISSPLSMASTREIVQYSTLHVESCLKLFCKRKAIKSYERKSLVPLLKSCKSVLADGLAKSLYMLGTGVGNVAKHHFAVGTEQPLFSIEDAFAVYLCCRKLGYEIIIQAGALTEILEACRTGPFLNPMLYV